MNKHHPANNVTPKGDYLKNKNVWLAITGSVSCVESVGIARELLRYGANVTIVANRAALELVGEKALEFACGKPIIKEITGQVEHVIAGHDADLLIVAPCCATSLGKMVHGIGDNPPMLVALTCIGAKVPIIVAPAMDKNMSNSKIVKQNLKDVKKFATILDPIMVEGKAKLPSKFRITAEACRIAGSNDLKKRKILIIGGGSSEEIDDVRVITNKSTGKMAKHLAETAFCMGAKVELWMGNATEEVGEWIKQESFSSTDDLNKKIKKLGKYDIILIPAALSDFIPTKIKGKISSQKIPEIKLIKAKKSIESIREKHNGLLCAFKLESGLKDNELLEKGEKLLKNSDFVIANHSEVLGNEKTKLAIITKKEKIWVEDTKANASKIILEKIAQKI
ncbi:MAG: bifunctional phosphopantothenoylcysteine decarboxylase/phosphopantothenate--cysteine ligase CoaBC [Candidatus Poseidoniia archaeon]|nr:bifunctional phosphopantothenoylcysteine decarboxylase/phosphopantothenate--cysteine ligase CoaBC [Candidatus Poseidoniia archaeon]